MIARFEDEYAFLSNFYPWGSDEWADPITIKGKTFPSAEHAYQAAKFLDPVSQEAIRNAITPGAAKRAARQATNLRPGWDEIRVDVMRVVLEHKFAAGTALADRLLATGDEYLMEGNTWGDTFWGTVNQAGNLWTGANQLGMLLMERREALRQQFPFDTDGATTNAEPNSRAGTAESSPQARSGQS